MNIALEKSLILSRAYSFYSTANHKTVYLPTFVTDMWVSSRETTQTLGPITQTNEEQLTYLELCVSDSGSLGNCSLPELLRT